MTARLRVARAAAVFVLVLPVSIAATNVALAVMALLLLAFQEQFDWGRIRHPLVYALGAYCAVSLACALAGTDPRESLGAVLKDFHKLWVACLLLLALDEPPRRAPLLLGVAFSFICAVGVVQVMTLETSGSSWVRAHGFVHAVTYGEQLAIGLLGALCLLRHGPSGPARRWLAGFIALCGAALILNQTRAALLSALCGLGGLALLDQKIRRRALWALPIVLVVAGAWEIMPTGGRSLRQALEGSRPWLSANSANPHMVRYQLWKAAVGMFRDHPWTGVGPGNYRANFDRYFTGNLAEPVAGSAHNLYLHQLAERGLLGAAALAAVLTVLVAGGWRRARRQPGPWTLWACAASVAFLVMNLFEVAFQNEQVTTLVIFVWVAAEAAARTRQQSPV